MSRDRERARRAGYRQGWFDAMQAMGIRATMPVIVPPSPYGEPSVEPVTTDDQTDG